MARLLRIPQPQFIRFRTAFRLQCEASGLILEMTRVTARSGESFDAFVGDSAKTKTTKTLPYLFDFEAVSSGREKYGISKDIDAVVYIPQEHLKSQFGILKFVDEKNRDSYRNYKIKFKNETFIIDAVNYLEELYGLCVAIQLNLKTDRKGG